MPPLRPWLARIACIAATLYLVALTAAHAQTTVVARPPASDYQQAMQLYRSAQYDKATARVEAWLKERPKDARGRFLKGMILSQQQKVDEAIRVYTDLTQDFPELPEPYNNLAAIYADRGDLDRALGLLDTAIRANPSFAAAQENLGDIHVRLAAAAYDKALRLDAKNSALAVKLKAANELVPSRPATADKPR